MNPGNYQIVNEDQWFKGNLERMVGKRKLKVYQQIRWGEALTLGCCEFNNHYKIMDEEENELFRVLEDSECMTRCFCSPLHTYKLRMVDAGAVEPQPNDFLLSQRTGCECIGCPKCLCCFVCNENCQEVVDVYTNDENQGGRFTLEEKICNGCSAELVIFYHFNNQKTPLAVIHGPTFFGGCAELCTDADFFITTCDKDCNITGRQGDVASLRKLKPDSCCSMLMEICTDIDRYEIDVNTECSWTKDPNFLGMVLSSLFALDYKFFESDHPYCDTNSDGSCLLITICNFYCYGCICPVQLCIPLKGGE